MVLDSEQARAARPLLGLRPPAELAVDPFQTPAAAAPAPEPEAPARPAYNKVSSGWDSEEDEARSGGSDLVTALRAAAVVVAVIGTIALLLR